MQRRAQQINEREGAGNDFLVTSSCYHQLACSRFRPAFSQMLGENRLGSISFDGDERADGYGFRFSGSFQEI